MNGCKYWKQELSLAWTEEWWCDQGARTRSWVLVARSRQTHTHKHLHTQTLTHTKAVVWVPSSPVLQLLCSRCSRSFPRATDCPFLGSRLVESLVSPIAIERIRRISTTSLASCMTSSVTENECVFSSSSRDPSERRSRFRRIGCGAAAWVLSRPAKVGGLARVCCAVAVTSPNTTSLSSCFRRGLLQGIFSGVVLLGIGGFAFR